MDNLETPYDEEAEFIECTVCNKSIRGETLFKIHLTTPAHTKKEDLCVAAGVSVKRHNVPLFEDIVQYLDYMKLDEPIIGLNYLDELPCNDPQVGSRYSCRLCHHTANMAEMVRHVIGRKHRQKYVEVKRPDLVTWDKQSIMTQGGKIIRARAEIIERQDGRGNPVLIGKKKKHGKPNMSRDPPRQRKSGHGNISQSSIHRDVTSHLPRLMDFEFDHRGKSPPSYPKRSPFSAGDSYTLSRGQQMYQQEGTLNHDPIEEERQRASYREGDTYRQSHMDFDYPKKYEAEYDEDGQQTAEYQPGIARYDSAEEGSYYDDQAQQADYYPEEASSHKSPERDRMKKNFYADEVRRGQGHSAEYQPSEPRYPGDNYRWSLDRESGRDDINNRASRQGSSEPEANRRSVTTSMESSRSHAHLFRIVRDYCHKMSEPHQEEAVSSPGPSRTGPPTSHRQVEISRAMPDIPEPFRRFLKGATNDEVQGKRKRKSRFSDATAEEVETTREMFNDEYGPPKPKFGSHSRPVGVHLRPEIHPMQHHNIYEESQSPHHTESYQRDGSDSGGVFDMLKNIEIENAEEADFLKNKLCDLLKEFKSKKTQKAVPNTQGRATFSKDYISPKLDSERSPRHLYGTTLGEDSDARRPEDLYFEEDHRERSWKEREHTPDKRLQEYHHPVQPRHLNRSRYQEGFEWPERSQTTRSTHSDEPAHNSDRFQEPFQTRDYRAANEEFLGSRSAAPSLQMEREPRMNRGSRYSSNLEKITSTLLELVARK